MRTILIFGATAILAAGGLVQCGGTDSAGSTSGSTSGSSSDSNEPSSAIAAWQKQLANGVDVNAVAADGTGNVFVAGAIHGGATSLSSQSMSSIGLPSANADVFVAKLDPLGNAIWSKRFGDADDQFAYAVATDDAGNAIVAGTFSGSLQFPGTSPQLIGGTAVTAWGTSLTAAGLRDIFVMKLDHAGRFVWATQIGGINAFSDVTSLAVGFGGEEIALTGALEHSVLDHAISGPTDAFVTLLDRSGSTRWTRRWFDGVGMKGTSVAIDAVGDILATGTFQGSVDLGNGSFTSAGGRDVFLAKLKARPVVGGPFTPAKIEPSKGGETMWSKAFGGQFDDEAIAVALDFHNNVVTLGEYTGVVDLGVPRQPGEELMSAYGGSFAQVYVAEYDSLGTLSWARRFGAGNAPNHANALAIDLAGSVYFSGRITAAVTIGSCIATPTLAVGQTGQAFVAKLDDVGNAICAKRYGEQSSQVKSLAIHPAGGLLTSGAFEGSITLVESVDPLVSNRGPAAFVARSFPFPMWIPLHR